MVNINFVNDEFFLTKSQLFINFNLFKCATPAKNIVVDGMRNKQLRTRKKE